MDWGELIFTFLAACGALYGSIEWAMNRFVREKGEKA